MSLCPLSVSPPLSVSHPFNKLFISVSSRVSDSKVYFAAEAADYGAFKRTSVNIRIEREGESRSNETKSSSGKTLSWFERTFFYLICLPFFRQLYSYTEWLVQMTLSLLKRGKL